MKKYVLLFLVTLCLLSFSSSVFAYDGYANPIKVHLTTTSESVAVKVSCSTYQVLDANGAAVSSVGEGTTISLGVGQTLSSVNGYGKFVYGDKEYRGDLINAGGYVVNKLPMEWYLYSVVSMEIRDYSPGIEALKAQAVAARGLASNKLKNPRSNYYNILSTTSDQAYGGYTEEKYNTVGIGIREACKGTENIVCYYNGVLANTIYCANTGGYTEDAAVVWGGNYPYMKSVISPYDSLGFEATNYTSSGSTYKTFKTPTGYQWVRTMTFEDISAKISGIGSIYAISVTNTASGYAQNVTFVGSGGSKSLSGEKVRSALGLKSGSFCAIVGKSVSAKSPFSLTYLEGSNFDNYINRANSTVTFEGRGYGHSVGMSQWGACVMAYKGMTYQQILNYYYNQNQNNGNLTFENYRG